MVSSPVRQFLLSVQGEYDYAMWLLFATTGMRRGEVCALRERLAQRLLREAGVHQRDGDRAQR